MGQVENQLCGGAGGSYWLGRGSYRQLFDPVIEVPVAVKGY